MNGFSKSARYLFGISGGRDSVALLEWLMNEGYRNLVLCHLNHQLRGEESDGDADLVRMLGEKFGLKVEIGSEDVAARAERESISIETAAREARHEFFGRCTEKFGTNRVFLAHHADDQVETILMNLFRGAGRRGLGGMEKISEIQVGDRTLTLIRPFLDRPRSEIPEPATFHEDTSNASTEFLRNRIRREVIPVIESATGRSLTSILRTAEIWREEEAFLDALAREKLAEVQMGDQLRAPELRELEPALQRRVIRLWLTALGIQDVGFEEVEAVRALMEPDAPAAKMNLPGDRHVRRREKRLFVE